MLPIYIVCHADCEPSAYLCTFFDTKNIPYEKINVINDDITQLDLSKMAGLIFMGGPYSVNDNHPWLVDELEFICKAIDKDIPIMGVCFGAQLVSKALGAEVSKTGCLEMGWHKIEVDKSNLNHLPPLNLDDTIEVFEWHEDVFSVPDGAIPIFSGSNHENQGYLYGKVLAMQFHLEMTEHMVCEWLERYEHCIPECDDYAQTPEYITSRLRERLNDLHKQADTIYNWWLTLGNDRLSGHDK